MTATVPVAAPPAVRPADDGGRQRLHPVSGLGLGVAVLWLSLLVLLPLAAIVAKAAGIGWSSFWSTLTDPAAVQAIRLTVLSALGVSLVNAVMGTLIAWVLVREPFPGRRFFEVLIDIPFALPTIVGGLVLLKLYSPGSPVGIDWLGTWQGVEVALLFVTVPFVVRAVQPVLEALDVEAEQAAASLGAGAWTRFRRIVLPPLLPAIASGATLAFGRAMGEYGSVVLISAGARNATVASAYIYNLINAANDDQAYAHAAVVATALLVISVLVIAAVGLLRRAAVRRG